jgi:6,7-dimethyl-8-ribityllumazine synthase
LTGRFDAVLAFGVLIRGETEHFRLVADASARGLQEVALSTGVPVLDGVLAVHDAAQAEARSGGVVGNRGAEVALAAVQMASLRRGPAFR